MTDSEIKITADLVHDLLQEQHPDLAGLAIRHDLPSDLGNVVLTAADDTVNVDRPASTVVT
ncbi:hypothetical protein FRAHR75_540042 [Frankia sp. Hr75.2]|nr:hypothetical protein FRAHR75_540042 [Frankia sp. Hr75.2]